MASSTQYYTPAKTNDDDDEEEERFTSSSFSSRTGSSGRRPPPPTQYRDDPSSSYRDNPTPSSSSSNHNNNNNNVADEENVPSIFDWGAPSSSSAATETTTTTITSSAAAAAGGNKRKQKKNNKNHPHATFDPDVEIPFTPISLHDDDDDDDSESDVSGADQLRPHVNGLFQSTINHRSRGGGGSSRRSHNGNLYGQISNNNGDDDNDEENDDNSGGRLFVGGGWGRHGTTTDYRWERIIQNCCCGGGSGSSNYCERKYCCGRNPYYYGNSYPFMCTPTGCFVMVFVMMTFLCGYLGYEAGLPVVVPTTVLDTTNNNNNNNDDGFETTKVTTHGDLWLEWIKKEKNEIHLPHIHLNFTKKHSPIIYTDDNNNLQLSFPPMSQSDLLIQSQHVFQSCSERSIATSLGRDACLSLCHGHYCCFEKDVEFGSCVTTANSYCFVYAACENVIMDFGFTNIDTTTTTGGGRGGGGGGSVDVDGLNRKDIDLLTATCSKDNVATLEGIRDCSAFCQHHLCCFSKDEGENCAADHVEECEAYESCRIISEGPDGNNNKGGGGGSGGSSITVTPEQVEQSVYDACYFGDDESKVTQGLVEKCHNVCASRYCCFDSQTIVSSCRDTVGEEECKLYSLCEQMINVRGDEVKNFIELDMKEFEGGGGSSITVTPEQVEQSVYDACYFGDDESKVTQGLVEKCHNVCASRYCCFDSQTIVSSCRDTVGEEECKLYTLCEQMINVRGDEVKNFIELDMKEFDFGSSSSTNNDVMSQNGSPGIPLNNAGMSYGGTTFIDEAEFEETLSEVTAVCDPNQSDDSWVSSCHALCADYLCCFSTDGTESNCKDVHGDDVCEAYSGCQVLQTSSTAESPQQQPQQTNDQIAEQVQIDEMTETCVPKIRRDAGLRERCRKVCEPRDCCWKSGVGNCYEMNTDWCEEFSLCEILVV